MKERFVTYRINRGVHDQFEIVVTTTNGQSFKRTGFQDVSAVKAALHVLREMLAVQDIKLVDFDKC